MENSEVTSYKDLGNTDWEVFEYIRNNPGVTRNDILSGKKLSWPSVSKIVNRLLSVKLITVTAEKTNMPGPNSEQLRINSDFGYFLGMSIGPSFIRLELVDFAFRPQGLYKDFYRRTIEKPSEGEPKLSDILHKTQSLITDFLNSYGNTNLLGFGIACPGIVDHERGIAIKARNLPIKSLQLHEIMTYDQFEGFNDKALVMDHNAKCAALAEKLVGNDNYSARPENNIVTIILAKSISAGFIFDGQVFRGASNYAGDFGFIKIEGDTTLEDKILEISDHVETDEDLVNLDHERLGFFLGRGLSYILNLLNPNLIVISGCFSQVYDLFQPKLIETTRELCSRDGLENSPIVKSRLSANSVAIGAAISAYNEWLIKLKNSNN